jgi:anti-sigma factor RsiW
MSDCEKSREHVLAAVRGELGEPERARFDRHLETCAGCRRIFERESALDQALAKRPTYALPSSLRAQLTARITPGKPAKQSFARAAAVFAPSLAAALLVLFVAQKWLTPNQELVGEAVNDHLRVLYAEHPVEIESGGIHQVKPWFTGRLDFAPAVSFSGDDEFPMQGGAIALFFDRKAASFIFKHKLHTITLFVFRSEGLSWPLRSNSSVGSLPSTSSHLRGFNTLIWRDADLGYALVSDVDPSELQRLAVKVSEH